MSPRVINKDMLVHAFKKGVLPGLFSESLIRSHTSTFAEIRRCALAHIVAKTEVSEKRGSAVPAKSRGGSGKSQQPMRVHEAREGKKDQGRGRARESNVLPRFDFVVELAELIAIPAIAARLRALEKTGKVLGRKKNVWRRKVIGRRGHQQKISNTRYLVDFRWVLSIDGSSNQQGSGAGVILEGPNGGLIEQSLRFAFKASNNQAEYEALIAGMLLAREMGARSLLAKSDSLLVTGQVTGEFQAKDPQMAAYLEYVQLLKTSFTEFELVHVPREQNARADLLAKLASSGKGGKQRTVIQETLKICVHGEQCARLMSELHEGVCGSHVGGRALASMILRAGYYWPTLKEDCVRYAQRCKQCQLHADWHKAPPEELKSIHSPWPFHTWGIDILGHFPLAIRQMKFLIVAIEYFTKWVEAEPVAHITAQKVEHFVWKNIVCRFGVPKRLVESANRVLLRGLKRRLEKAKGKWAEEVPRIVWSYHTTPQSSTHETPFSLVYGTDAMIPVEIQESSPRFLNFIAEESNEERKVNLDLLDEVREEARVSVEAVKRRVERRHNSKVRLSRFQKGDLVMRKAHQNEMENKLSPKWTGPYRVVEALENGAYWLETLEGGAIPRTWNATHLKFYFN
ncbi:uncharacterized protein [Phaseolus vulgaris]|uniref:uncharacterized protein n=1 Tax=Phaseolus vulgaris TaxID=3885 RepID=UPI0035C97FA7